MAIMSQLTKKVPVQKDPLLYEYFRVWRRTTSISRGKSTKIALINGPSELNGKYIYINGHCSVGPNR